MLTNFRELLFEEGLHFSTTVLARTVMMPVDDLDIRLNISRTNTLFILKDCASSTMSLSYCRKPISLTISVRFFLKMTSRTSSLFDLFEKKYGIKITKVKTYIEIISSEGRRCAASRPA